MTTLIRLMATVLSLLAGWWGAFQVAYNLFDSDPNSALVGLIAVVVGTILAILVDSKAIREEYK